MPTLIASTTSSFAGEGALPPSYTIRASQPPDIPALGHLYFATYPAGVIETTADEALEDIVATFDGRHGALWRAASPVIVTGGELVSAVLTVHRAPWEDTPNCPFIVEVFTATSHRRRGLARAALLASLAVLHASGERKVALRVDADNLAALALYASLGFSLWEPDALS